MDSTGIEPVSIPSFKDRIRSLKEGAFSIIGKTARKNWQTITVTIRIPGVKRPVLHLKAYGPKEWRIPVVTIHLRTG